jgi:hypothetical protein
VSGYLLHGEDLVQAETWLSQAAEKDSQLTAIQTQTILASREATTRRQRLTLIAVAHVLVNSIGLSIFAWTQRNQAESEGNMRATAQAEAVQEAQARSTAQFVAEAASTEAVAQRNKAQYQTRLARSGFFASESFSHLEGNLDLTNLLAIEALNNVVTLQAHGSLLTALQYYPQLGRFLHGHSGNVGAAVFSPEGFQCQLTLRADTGQELLERVKGAISHLLSNGCYPYSYRGGYPQNNQTMKSNGDGKQHNGNPSWCPIHQCEMKRWDRDGRSWYSHKTSDGGWCKGQ